MMKVILSLAMIVAAVAQTTAAPTEAATTAAATEAATTAAATEAATTAAATEAATTAAATEAATTAAATTAAATEAATTSAATTAAATEAATTAAPTEAATSPGIVDDVEKVSDVFDKYWDERMSHEEDLSMECGPEFEANWGPCVTTMGDICADKSSDGLKRLMRRCSDAGQDKCVDYASGLMKQLVDLQDLCRGREETASSAGSLALGASAALVALTIRAM